MGPTRSASRAACRATRPGSSSTAPTAARSATARPSSASTQRSGADGTIVVAADSEAGVEHVRWVLGLDDDHSEFARRFADDPLLGETLQQIRGLRPMRTATVAQALLRAVAGQLIQAKRAREIERNVIRAATPKHGDLNAAPTCADLARFSPPQLERLGLGARRGARADPPLPRPRPRAAQGAPYGGRRGAAPARARPRALVGGRHLPRRARPLRGRPEARPGHGHARRERCGDAASSPRKRTCCWRRTGSGPASQACTSSPDTTRGFVPLAHDRLAA